MIYGFTRAITACSALVLTLGSCNTNTQSGGQVLQFLTTSLGPAYVNEAYQQNIQLSSGTRPYTLKRAKGELPAGLVLSGYTLSGTPTVKLDQPKTYTFSLEATDANLANKVQEFTLTLNPERPSSLEWALPGTSVTGEQRIPFTMKSPRLVKSYRITIPWPKGATLVRLEPADGKPILFSKLEKDVLTIHGGLTEPIQTMKEVTAFYLVLNLPTSTKIEGKIGFEVRSSGRSVSSQEMTTGTPKPAQPATPTPPTNPAPPTPPGSSPPAPTTPPTPPTNPAPPSSPTPPAPPPSPTPPAPPAPGGSK